MENRVYPTSAAYPGPRDPYLTPYVIPIEQAVSDGKYKRVVAMMGAQSGKSESILDIIGQRFDQRPCPILYVGPNKQFLTEQIEPRFMALLDEAPTLMDKVARGKRMTKTRKVIAGVPLRLAHAGSSTALKSDPAGMAFIDEYDEMRSNVNEQGGPLGLVERRGDTYADFVCMVTSTPKQGRVTPRRDERSGLIFWGETPTDEIESPIWLLWQQGTRHHWCWPCPECGEYFVPRFNLLRYPEKCTPYRAMRETTMECPNCGGVIEEIHKTSMNERGRFVAPGQTINKEGVVSGDPPQVLSASFWVSGLASPFVTLGERVATYLEAVESGDDAMVQQAINGGFGELYSPGGGDLPDWAEIKAKSRRSGYERGRVHEDALYLSMSVDVQKQSLYWVQRAWGPKATSWLVDYGQLLGDTSEEEVWEALTELLDTPVDGMTARVCFIDSGFRPGKKDELPLNRVYEWCRQHGKRARPTKGSSNAMRTPLVISKIEVNRKGKAAKFGLELFRLDTDHWKSWVQERMRWQDDRPGAWHLPTGVDDDYCHQLVSEARVRAPNGKPAWVQRSKANHYFDCEAMQAATGYVMNVQRIPLPKEKTPVKDTSSETVDVVDVDDEAPAEAPPRAQTVASRPRPGRARRIVRSGYMM